MSWLFPFWLLLACSSRDELIDTAPLFELARALPAQVTLMPPSSDLNPIEIAKAVLDATRPYKIVKVKGAILGSRAIDADGVTRLATLPPRDVLLAQIAGAIAAPIATLAGLFDAPLRDVAGGIGALADQRASGAT